MCVQVCKGDKGRTVRCWAVPGVCLGRSLLTHALSTAKMWYLSGRDLQALSPAAQQHRAG